MTIEELGQSVKQKYPQYQSRITTSFEPSIPIDERNVFGKVADVINSGLDSYMSAPVIKQVGQVTGAAFAIPSAVIGGAVGAIGTPIKNVIQNKPVFQDFGKNVVDNAKKTGEFAYNIGSQAPMAPIALAGKAVTLPLAYAQGVQGARDISTGYKTGDIPLMVQGGIEFGSAALGTRSSLKTKGLVVDKSVMPGFEEAQKTKAAETMKSVLNQGKSEAKAEQRMILKQEKVTRSKQSEPAPVDTESVRPEVARTLVDEGVKIEQNGEGKMDTTNARRRVQSSLDNVENELARELAKDPTPKHSSEELKKRAYDQINSREDMTATEKKGMRAEIDTLIGDEAQARGLKPTDDFLMNDEELHSFKRGVGRMAGDYSKPAGAQEVYRNLRNKAKTMIEEKNSSKIVEKLNKREGALIEADKALENAHGRAIRGGFFGKKFSQLIGTSVGSAAGSVFGPFGAATGGVLGAGLSGAGYEAYISPSRRTGGALRNVMKPTAFDMITKIPLRKKRED